MTTGMSTALLLFCLGCDATSAGLANAPKLGRMPPRGGPTPDVIANGFDSCERGASARPPPWPGSPACPPPPSAQALPPPRPPAPVAPSPGPAASPRSWHPTICVARSPFSEAEISDDCCGSGCPACVADAASCGPLDRGPEGRP